MKITDRTYLDHFNILVGNKIPQLVEQFDFSRNNTDLDYQTQVSAVFSSNIEGNSIDVNSFMNHRLSKAKHKPGKELQEIEDLILAYELAQNEPLTEKNFQKAHKTLSKQLLIANFRGKYRDDKVGVFGESGLVYLAIEPEYVAKTMHQFFVEVAALLSTTLTVAEAFYFAALVHLRFVHIHPFRDGNGRVARLLEKWFLTQKLGRDYWTLPSEKYYKVHQADYYRNINLGVNFYELDYDKCLPFLAMLPYSLKN